MAQSAYIQDKTLYKKNVIVKKARFNVEKKSSFSHLQAGLSL